MPPMRSRRIRLVHVALVALGLVALAVGAWALLTTPGPGHDEIDPASRAELERVLREAAEEEPR